MPVLSDDRVRALAAAAQDADRIFGGGPQDVEWVLADGKVWLVQAPARRLQLCPQRTVDFGGALVERHHQQRADDEVTDLLAERGAAPLRRPVQQLSQRDGGGELLLGWCPGEAADEGQRRIPSDDSAEHIGVEAVHGQSISGAARSCARRRAA